MADTQGKGKDCCAMIVAAGSGVRFGSHLPKQFVTLAEQPLLLRTALAFDTCPSITAIVVVAAREMIPKVETLLGGIETSLTVCAGGAARSDSVRAGLAHLPARCLWVAVHDGARPLVTPTLIEAVIAAAREHGAAIPALRPPETVKRLVGDAVAETLDRDTLRLAQTPQVFDVSLLADAYARYDGAAPTDDAQVVEAAGHTVRVIQGDPHNLKITFGDDLIVAEGLLASRGERWRPTMRSGIGYDVHRLEPGDGLILGGVTIAADLRLVGHSDADVVAHAAADALLGAAALGDLGTHFPPGDPTFKGADSIELLAEVVAMVHACGYRVSNLDCTIVCQRPKLAPHIAAMRENFASALQVGSDAVGVKATTTEGLGFAGRGEGIAAHATVLIVEGVA